MLIFILIVLNIPIYLFLAWVVFDTKEAAAETIFGTVVALLKIILVPKIVRVMLDMDDGDAIGLFSIAAFLFGCAAVTYGEYWLLQKYFFTT